jgi:hypothetical protein
MLARMGCKQAYLAFVIVEGVKLHWLCRWNDAMSAMRSSADVQVHKVAGRSIKTIKSQINPNPRYYY